MKPIPLNRALYALAGAFMFSAVVFVGVKGHTTALNPGPLSAIQATGLAPGGYASHAEFEQECGHCHAPIHCITDSRCQECHLEVAQDRMNAVGLHGRLPASRCQDCHVEHQGREAVISAFAFRNVDHEKLAGFSLTAHQADYGDQPLTCNSCHSQDKFRSQSLDCVSCHADEDHDFLSDHIELYGTTCVPCHDGKDRMAGFDHVNFYPLNGGHGELECVDCHADQEFAEHTRTCSGCHEDPQVHLGLFGTDCQRCHTDQAWKPALLTRHAFALDHGAEANLPCDRCHLENYAEFTCYECHDHDQDEDRQTHAAEGLNNIEACGECHPTGAAGEASIITEFEGEHNLDAGLQPDFQVAGSPGKQNLKSVEKGEGKGNMHRPGDAESESGPDTGPQGDSEDHPPNPGS
jgi:hypothetical protein